MGKVYKSQTALTVRAVTGKVLENGDQVKLRYKDPLGEVSEFDATIHDPVMGVIERIGPLPKIGKWTLWAKVEDVQGLISIGTPFIINIFDEGT